jgi:hypothetical protein
MKVLTNIAREVILVVSHEGLICITSSMLHAMERHIPRMCHECSLMHPFRADGSPVSLTWNCHYFIVTAWFRKLTTISGRWCFVAQPRDLFCIRMTQNLCSCHENKWTWIATLMESPPCVIRLWNQTIIHRFHFMIHSVHWSILCNDEKLFCLIDHWHALLFELFNHLVKMAAFKQ